MAPYVRDVRPRTDDGRTRQLVATMAVQCACGNGCKDSRILSVRRMRFARWQAQRNGQTANRVITRFDNDDHDRFVNDEVTAFVNRVRAERDANLDRSRAVQLLRQVAPWDYSDNINDR